MNYSPTPLCGPVAHPSRCSEPPLCGVLRPAGWSVKGGDYGSLRSLSLCCLSSGRPFGENSK